VLLAPMEPSHLMVIINAHLALKHALNALELRTHAQNAQPVLI